MKRAFTLMELLMVVMIISIVFGIALPGFNKMKEDGQDKKATANLRRLHEAEKFYYLENNSYYASSVIADINTNLKLQLSTTDTDWAYSTRNTGCVQATRNGSDGRSWYFLITDTDETPKPNSGVCP